MFFLWDLMSRIMCNGSKLNNIKQPGPIGLPSRSRLLGCTDPKCNVVTLALAERPSQLCTTKPSQTITNATDISQDLVDMFMRGYVMVKCCFQTTQFVAACCILSALIGSFFSSSVVLQWQAGGGWVSCLGAVGISLCLILMGKMLLNNCSKSDFHERWNVQNSTPSCV